MTQKTIIYILVLLLVLIPLKPSECQAASNTGAAAKISISSSVVIGGVALFFYIRHIRTNYASADTIITRIDSLWSSTNSAYLKEDYTGAKKTAEIILSDWNRFLDALDKRKKRTKITKDSLTTIIHQSVLYQQQKPSLDFFLTKVSTLPHDQDQLLSWNRHDLNAVCDTILKAVKDTVNQHVQDSLFLTKMYNQVIKVITRIDTLFSSVYESEAQNFSIKNRFFYNRMQEQKSSIALARFVDDCNYYNIDKEWCEKARIQLNPEIVKPQEPVVTRSETVKTTAPVKKVTPVDSMNQQFVSVMQTRTVEQLENFIQRYSSKKYKIKAQIDTARVILDKIRKEIREEQQFTSDHPRISDGSVDKLSIVIRGVSNDEESKFRQVIDNLKSEISSLSSIRFPATLSIDYSTTPPLYLLSGYVHSAKDISGYDSLNQRRYTIQGARQGFILLDNIARNCSDILSNNSGNAVVQPSYAVRLLKNGEIYLTMYGYGNPTQGVDLYNFYDYSLPGHKNVRTAFTPSSFDITLNESGDTLQSKLKMLFFMK